MRASPDRRSANVGEMIVPGPTCWNIGIGREPGDVEKDAEGIQTMKDLGRNMAWLLKKIQAEPAYFTVSAVFPAVQERTGEVES